MPFSAKQIQRKLSYIHLSWDLKICLKHQLSDVLVFRNTPVSVAGNVLPLLLSTFWEQLAAVKAYLLVCTCSVRDSAGVPTDRLLTGPSCERTHEETTVSVQTVKPQSGCKKPTWRGQKPACVFYFLHQFFLSILHVFDLLSQLGGGVTPWHCTRPECVGRDGPCAHITRSFLYTTFLRASTWPDLKHISLVFRNIQRKNLKTEESKSACVQVWGCTQGFLCVCFWGSSITIETGNKQDEVEEVVAGGVKHKPLPFILPSHTRT